jgi:hypothetical protein
MKPPKLTLAERKEVRAAAQAVLRHRWQRLSGDLKPAALRRKVVSDLKHKSLTVATEAIEIANDSRGVVAGTLAVLALWLARKPIAKLAGDSWRRVVPGGRGETAEQKDEADD